MTPALTVRSKRAYDPVSEDDGRRYLIDRLWPRGCSASGLELAGWLKELAPSDELRRWFGHVPSRYPEFRRRYRAELAQHRERLEALAGEARRTTVTLVFGARDADRSNASVLAELLEEVLRARRTAVPLPARGSAGRRRSGGRASRAGRTGTVADDPSRRSVRARRRGGTGS